MSDVEYADGYPKSSFPEEWGTPPGSAYSETRARWVEGEGSGEFGWCVYAATAAKANVADAANS
jgi:hypothetical protein